MSKPLYGLPLDLQTFLGQRHQLTQPGKELLPATREVANSRHVDGHNTDATGKGIGAKQTPTSLPDLRQIQPQAAAHTSRIFGLHVGIDKIGEIGNAILRRHLPQNIPVTILPIEIPGDAVGRDREGENTSLRIPCHHNLAEGFVEHIHLTLELTIGRIHELATHYGCFIPEQRRSQQIKRQIGERCLKANPRRYIQAEYEFLHCLLDILILQAVVSDEGRQKSIKVGKRLGARSFSLKGVEEIDNLPQRTAKMLRRRALHLPPNSPKAFQ